VISKGAEIIPIEVKAGKAGTLKSLRLFVDEKRVGRAVRFNAEPPSILRERDFELISLPLYLAGQLRRIIG
ncbi:MAG: AAA+ family ATPase, partial [Elusimicrobia bacterium]|nr:AAA+ family ATPase [Elusimicrobiota bacterium]